MTKGFLLKCGASRSPNSQRLGSAFSASLALNLFALFHFLASTSTNGALFMAQPTRLSKVTDAWRVKTEYTLACSQAGFPYLSSRDKYPA